MRYIPHFPGAVRADAPRQPEETFGDSVYQADKAFHGAESGFCAPGRISELEARIAQIPSRPAGCPGSGWTGVRGAQGTAGGVSISEAAGRHTAEPETVVLRRPSEDR